MIDLVKQKIRHHNYYLKHKQIINKQSIEWDRQIKRKALEKLGGVCKKCGTTQKLQLHHKYYARDSIRPTQNETGRATINRSKEALNHPERFEVLCLSCHNKLEKTKPRRIVSLANFEQISRSVKEKMVQVEKAEVGGTPYLNRKTVNDKGVKKIKIISEPVFVETEFEGKKSTRLEALCSTQVADPKQVKWQMNPTSQNYMVDKYGSDSKNWIGKEIEIAVKQAGSASPAVYPKDCSLEKVIA